MNNTTNTGASLCDLALDAVGNLGACLRDAGMACASYALGSVDALGAIAESYYKEPRPALRWTPGCGRTPPRIRL